MLKMILTGDALDRWRKAAGDWIRGTEKLLSPRFRSACANPILRINADSIFDSSARKGQLDPEGMKAPLRLPFDGGLIVEFRDWDGDECVGCLFEGPLNTVVVSHFCLWKMPVYGEKPVPPLAMTVAKRSSSGVLDGSPVMTYEPMMAKSPGDLEHQTSVHLTLLHAAALLNCKNVFMQDVPLTGSQQRAAKRGEPAVKYKELVVRPLAPKTRADSDGSSSGDAAIPLHQCRGHFRHYEEGASTGLFGRGVFGTFWVPAHVRGKEENGVVNKDYVLETA
jgi:hypothetical protein